MYLSYNILTIIGNIRICVYVFIGFLTNIVTLVEAPKPVIKVICQGMGLRMGTGHVKAKVEERKTLTVYHCISVYISLYITLYFLFFLNHKNVLSI